MRGEKKEKNGVLRVREKKRAAVREREKREICEKFFRVCLLYPLVILCARVHILVVHLRACGFLISI
jgi:hypothetical protein